MQNRRQWRPSCKNKSNNLAKEAGEMSLERKVPPKLWFRGKPTKKQRLNEPKKLDNVSLRINSKLFLGSSQIW